MDYSRKISERQWNLPDKGELESRREATYIDDIKKTGGRIFCLAPGHGNGLFCSSLRNTGIKHLAIF